MRCSADVQVTRLGLSGDSSSPSRSGEEFSEPLSSTGAYAGTVRGAPSSCGTPSRRCGGSCPPTAEGPTALPHMMPKVGEPYDAVVVGSGACGGWAAKELTENGLRVALVEAGPLFFSTGDSLGPAPVDAERQPIQSQCYALSESTSHLFVDDVDNPYSFPEGKPFY